jgi:hypothetical protein
MFFFLILLELIIVESCLAYSTKPVHVLLNKQNLSPYRLVRKRSLTRPAGDNNYKLCGTSVGPR